MKIVVDLTYTCDFCRTKVFRETEVDAIDTTVLQMYKGALPRGFKIKLNENGKIEKIFCDECADKEKW